MKETLTTIKSLASFGLFLNLLSGLCAPAVLTATSKIASKSGPYHTEYFFESFVLPTFIGTITNLILYYTAKYGILKKEISYKILISTILVQITLFLIPVLFQPFGYYEQKMIYIANLGITVQNLFLINIWLLFSLITKRKQLTIRST